MDRSSSFGFTLVELLVSIGIFTLITTVSVFNYSSFNSSVTLTNLAYEIALSIRQAQFYGVNVKQSSTGDDFDSGYGVHFDLSQPTRYVLFEDRDADHVYDSNQDEDLETFVIQKGNRISKVCMANPGNGTIDCNGNVTSADISFVRPNPDSFIVRNGNANPSQLRPSAVICLSSPKASYRKITVTSTGQISVSTDASLCI